MGLTAFHANAFTHSWTGSLLYAFLPFKRHRKGAESAFKGQGYLCGYSYTLAITSQGTAALFRSASVTLSIVLFPPLGYSLVSSAVGQAQTVSHGTVGLLWGSWIGVTRGVFIYIVVKWDQTPVWVLCPKTAVFSPQWEIWSFYTHLLTNFLVDILHLRNSMGDDRTPWMLLGWQFPALQLLMVDLWVGIFWCVAPYSCFQCVPSLFYCMGPSIGVDLPSELPTLQEA